MDPNINFRIFFQLQSNFICIDTIPAQMNIYVQGIKESFLFEDLRNSEIQGARSNLLRLFC